MGFSAVNTGNNLLFLVVASLLGFMAVTGLAGWINIRRIGIEVSFSDEIYDGNATIVTVRVANRKKFVSSFLLQVDMLGAQVCIPIAERGSIVADSFLVSVRGRGRKSLESVTLSSRFPINFFVRKRNVPVRACFTVFPAPLECPPPDGSGRRDNKGEGISSRKGYGGDLIRIRDYTGSEPMKLIHWKLSARHEILKVKELATPSEIPLIIDVLSLPGGTLEENLSYGVYLVNRTIRSGRPVGLKLGNRVISSDLDRTHRLRLLSELAVYGTR